jgi:hypothetical protein
MTRADRTSRWHGRAFGIDVQAGFPIPELPAGRASRNPTSAVEPASAAELRRGWPAQGAERLVERVHPNGRLMMAVEHHDDAGFHVWAPYYGRHLVSADGSLVRSALPAVAAWRWERLLFAQVLPLAAALRGRELFHASAVSLDGAAIAFVGFPGAGKSSIAAHLVAHGASLVTDDVLALEGTDAGVTAHPGSGLASVERHELAAMSAGGRARLGRRVGTADKAYFSVSVVDGPLPLRALYYITRGRVGAIEIGPSGSLPSRLLGSAFIAYLRSPQHLVDHLDVCTHVAATVPVLELSVPATARAVDVACAVERHAHALPGAEE